MALARLASFMFNPPSGFLGASASVQERWSGAGHIRHQVHRTEIPHVRNLHATQLESRYRAGPKQLRWDPIGTPLPRLRGRGTLFLGLAFIEVRAEVLNPSASRWLRRNPGRP